LHALDGSPPSFSTKWSSFGWFFELVTPPTADGISIIKITISRQSR